MTTTWSGSIPEGKKQYALSFTLQDPEKTLTDQDVEKVMDNLFTNALKHTGNQGIIRITASCHDGKLMVSIFNNGEPIEKSRLKNVFKRYYQLSVTEGNHHYGWGTGIGLYYVKRLIGLHHGEISVRNVISQGNEENEEDENRKDGASGVEFSFWIPVDQSIYTPSEQVKEKTGVMQIPLVDIHGISTEEEKEAEAAEEKTSTDSAEESSESPKKPKMMISMWLNTSPLSYPTTTLW